MLWCASNVWFIVDAVDVAHVLCVSSVWFAVDVADSADVIRCASSVWFIAVCAVAATR